MIDRMEKSDLDQVWVIKECIKMRTTISDKKLESFTERVSILCEAGIPEDEAREMALNIVLYG